MYYVATSIPVIIDTARGFFVKTMCQSSEKPTQKVSLATSCHFFF